MQRCAPCDEEQTTPQWLFKPRPTAKRAAPSARPARAQLGVSSSLPTPTTTMTDLLVIIGGVPHVMPSAYEMGGDVDGIVVRNVTVWLHKTELLDLEFGPGLVWIAKRALCDIRGSRRGGQGMGPASRENDHPEGKPR
jgi:hypothetical protein